MNTETKCTSCGASLGGVGNIIFVDRPLDQCCGCCGLPASDKTITARALMAADDEAFKMLWDMKSLTVLTGSENLILINQRADRLGLKRDEIKLIKF